MLGITAKPIQKSIYFDEKSLGLLDAFANQLSISRSSLIRILINQYCKDKQNSFEVIKQEIDLLNRRD